jgi:23S rRNA pseudouridine2604 synthase
MKNNKKFETPELENGVRINKYLSDAGLCSRREADVFVEKGQVTVDGVVAQNGTKVLSGQEVVFCGKTVSRDDNQVLIAFYKPVGIVCTTDTKREPDNVIDFINYPKRIFPIGRLDKDSEGLLLLTNDGDIVNKILRAGNKHEKEYEVTVNKPVTPEFLKGMATGVPILDTVTKPCKIEPTGKKSFKIILTQGLNRQIRRMCEYFDYKVVSLKRVRVMHITLNNLKVGEYRHLTTTEREELKRMLKSSSKLAAKDTAKSNENRKRIVKHE